MINLFCGFIRRPILDKPTSSFPPIVDRLRHTGVPPSLLAEVAGTVVPARSVANPYANGDNAGAALMPVLLWMGFLGAVPLASALESQSWDRQILRPASEMGNALKPRRPFALSILFVIAFGSCADAFLFDNCGHSPGYFAAMDRRRKGAGPKADSDWCGRLSTLVAR